MILQKNPSNSKNINTNLKNLTNLCWILELWNYFPYGSPSLNNGHISLKHDVKWKCMAKCSGAYFGLQRKDFFKTLVIIFGRILVLLCDEELDVINSIIFSFINLHIYLELES